MKLDIKVKYNDAYNCLDNLIIEVAKWWGREHELLFIESWGFTYRQKNDFSNETIGENIRMGRNCRWDYFEKYHGIKVNFIKDLDYRDILDLIRRELREKRPVIIYMNSFWCPWNTDNYQKINTAHYCLVTDIDNENNLSIVDNQMAMNGDILSEYNFSKGYGECVTFELKEQEDISGNWRMLIENAVNRRYNSVGISTYEQMRNFANDIKNKLDIERETYGMEKYPFRSALYQTIFNLVRGRKQFARALNYLGNLNYNLDLISVSKKMKSVGEKWMSIFGVLCKVYYLQGDNKIRIINRIANRINEIALEEEEIAKSLSGLCKNEMTPNHMKLVSHDNHLIKEPLIDYFYIDIAKQMNNQGFSSSISPDSKAELSNGGRYFLTEGLPAEREWIVENMRFLFPEVNKEKNDNISCFGQVIEIFPHKYSKIMFLGCGELGNHSEEIEITYRDGSKEKFTLQFPTWLMAGSSFNETVAWTGKAANRGGKSVEIFPYPAKLFAQIYSLQNSSEIENIKLPECPNIHIFAITLANEC